MALHSQKDFAELCGLSPANFSTYKTRKKVLVREDGLVDAKAPINAAFLQKWSEKNKNKPKAEITTAPSPPSIEKLTDEPQYGILRPQKKTKQPRKNSDEYEAEDLVQLEIDKTVADIELKQQRKVILELDEQRKRGEQLPIKPTKSIFLKFSENLKVQYLQGIDKLLVIIQQRKELSAEDMAYIKSNLNEVVNQALKKGIEATKRNIRDMLTEYAQAGATSSVSDENDSETENLQNT